MQNTRIPEQSLVYNGMPITGCKKAETLPKTITCIISTVMLWYAPRPKLSERG